MQAWETSPVMSILWNSMMFAILHYPIPVSINYFKGVLGVSHFAGQAF